jgi:hypothetical protein
MSLALTADVANRLTAALHENSVEAAKLRNAYLASLPQFLDLKQLCTRYAIDAKQLRAVLIQKGIRFQPYGRGLRVHVTEYRRLDALLGRES